jgi:hypothetical protein
MDAFVRAERAGLVWKTNKRAWAIQLQVTHDRIGERTHDARNQLYFEELLADPGRIDPVEPWGEPLASDGTPKRAETADTVAIPRVVPTPARDDGNAAPGAVSSVSGDSRADGDKNATESSDAQD